MQCIRINVALPVSSRPSRSLACLFLTKLETLCKPSSVCKLETLSLPHTSKILYTALSKHLSKTRVFASDKLTASKPYNKKGKQYDFNSSTVVNSELAPLLLENIQLKT